MSGATRVEIADAETTRELRRAVLRPGLAPDAPMPGDADDAIHLAARDGDEVVGTAVLLPRPSPVHPDVAGALQLRAMAVAPDRRGTGVGRLIMAEVLRIAAERGAPILWCNARTTARGFYEAAGLRVEGPEFVTADTGVGHHVMWRAVG